MTRLIRKLVPKRYVRPFLVSAALLVVVLASMLWFLFFAPVGDGSNVCLVNCAKGAPLQRVAADMETRRIIRSARAFVFLARIKMADSRIQAGTYQVRDSMTLSEILRKMVAGEIYELRFAVPEGYSIYQLAELLESRKIFRKAEFMAACTDKGLLKEFGIPAGSVEGYLYPATYNITPSMKPEDCVRMMISLFEQASGDRVSSLFRKRGKERHEMVVLASLVEKEAMDPTERPLIASVFHNRLKKGMRLQSDPTAVYGVRAFAGNVTRRDILRKTPYNTYLINGLPPGPIGNPGPDALKAALSPATTTYLYFVAKKDGTHHFSETLDQHNKAVNKYLKAASVNGAGQGRRSEYRNDRPSLTGRR